MALFHRRSLFRSNTWKKIKGLFLIILAQNTANTKLKICEVKLSSKIEWHYTIFSPAFESKLQPEKKVNLLSVHCCSSKIKMWAPARTFLRTISTTNLTTHNLDTSCHFNMMFWLANFKQQLRNNHFKSSKRRQVHTYCKFTFT